MLKCRQDLCFPPRLAPALLVVLSMGVLWLAASGTRSPSANDFCTADAVPVVSRSLRVCQPGDTPAPPAQEVTVHRPGTGSFFGPGTVWVRGEKRACPLTARLPDGSRTVLAGFPFEEQEPRTLSEAVGLEPPAPRLFPYKADELDQKPIPNGWDVFGPLPEHGLASQVATQHEPFPPAAFDANSLDEIAEECLPGPREPFGFDERLENLSPDLQPHLSLTPASEAASTDGEDSSRAGNDSCQPPLELSSPPRTQSPEQGASLFEMPHGGPAARSRELELIAREADTHTRRGFELAGRKAYFSARAEFVMALRLLAQGLDDEHQTRTHSRALAAGWTALKEADDFIPTGSRLEADLDLASIIGAHRTPVLKDAPVESLTPLACLQCYFTFAQEQLAACVGNEVAGSMALHALGNLHRALANKRSDTVRAASAKAVVFYQAALLVSPENYMASNELGVLLARGGRYEEARLALEHSLSNYQHSAGWYNLSVVYRRLGRTDLARAAYRRHQAICQQQTGGRKRPSPASRQQVEWVDPETFARSYASPSGVDRPMPPFPLSMEGKTWGAESARLVTRRAACLSNRWEDVPDAAFACPGAGMTAKHVVAASCKLIEAVASDTGTLYHPASIRLCQALGPAAPSNVCAVDCSGCSGPRWGGWERARTMAWQAYAQGEYVGHDRTAHVPEYRLRVDDLLDLVYRVTREEIATPYRLNVGDEVRVESFIHKDLDRERLIIQPDGTITLRLLGQVHATGRTLPQLRDEIEERYKEYYHEPAITVTPLKVNSKLEDLRSVVDSRYGPGGQTRPAKITPEGTIALPVVGSVQAQGLTLPELQQELNELYREEIEGMEVIPVLVQRAPRYVYVMGEVANSGRFELSGPTTVIQALSMAGSWNVGANLRQIVIFRRGDDWRLMATMVNLQAALNGNQACPAGEIWLSDSDVVIVPKGPILRADDFIDLVFTRGIYGVFPMTASINFSKLSTI